MARMSKEEPSRELHTNGWSLAGACEIIFMKTGAIIRAKSIQNLLDKEGRLSNTLTALFRFLFNHYGVAK